MSLNVLMALFLEERSNVRISTLQEELEVNGYMKLVNYGKQCKEAYLLSN